MNELAQRLKQDPCPLCKFEIRMPCFNEATQCLEIRCVMCGTALIVPEEAFPLQEDEERVA